MAHDVDWVGEAYAELPATEGDATRTARATSITPDQLRLSWLRLQILHTPHTAVGDARYWALNEALRGIERLLLERPALDAYYFECFGSEEKPEGPAPASLTLPSSAELRHIVSMQADFMEEVYYTLELGRYGNAPDNRSWMNLFRRWGRSKRFNEHLDAVRSVLALDFLEFYDLYVRYFECRIDEEPIPHAWDAKSNRADPRPPTDRPPPRSGGSAGQRCDPGPTPTSLTQEPEAGYLPGVFLDPGIREVSPRTGERPAEPGARDENS